MVFRAKKFEFLFPRPALLMGVVNVTPDSFSDGGRFASTEAAVSHALKLIEQGADILDIGGESTRPRATPVSADEEMKRVLPVIENLAGQISVPISIDTMKPAVARAALAAGASIVNDIAANRDDSEMWQIVSETGAGYILMHMQGNPQTMQMQPVYKDVVSDVNEFFEERLNKISECGVHAAQLVLDVGIGFGKTLEHNLQLLQGLRSFAQWQRPLLLGVSRKSFMGQLLGTKVTERLPASIACACWAVQQGVQMIRTHDVAETKLALRMTEALSAKE
jgi:dihydropteroate synthase